MSVYVFMPLPRPLTLVDSKSLVSRAILSRACLQPYLRFHFLFHGFPYLGFRIYYFLQQSSLKDTTSEDSTHNHSTLSTSPQAWKLLIMKTPSSKTLLPAARLHCHLRKHPPSKAGHEVSDDIGGRQKSRRLSMKRTSPLPAQDNPSLSPPPTGWKPRQKYLSPPSPLTM